VEQSIVRNVDGRRTDPRGELDERQAGDGRRRTERDSRQRDRQLD
jgi:hypothetical protein